MGARPEIRQASQLALGVAAGLALADASIVTLGLPSILVELDSSVEGVALVLGVYTAVLALALPAAAALSRRIGAAHLAAAGIALFGLASLGCGLVDALGPLLVLRAVQAVGAAGTLIGSFALLDGGSPGPGRRIWFAASIFGAAIGPALGGTLTEAFDWRAIFLAQVPLIAPAALVAVNAARAERRPDAREASEEPADSPLPLRPALALALLSAALTAVIFLVVLMLVAGWSIDPLAAALAVTVLPVAAIAASRIPGDSETRASAGCVLVAGGIACLALIPAASAWWTVVPQILAGAGMGLALPALAGELLPERTQRDVARVLSIRHAGIALALALLAPIVSSSLDSTIADAREEGTAALLDARLAPETKIELAPLIFADVNTDDPRGQLDASLDGAGEQVDDDEASELDTLGDRLDDVVTGAVRSAFRIAFIVTAALALAAALVLAWGALAPGVWVARTAVAASALVAAAATGAYAIAYDDSERERIVIADPCTADRDLPGTGGIGGILQDVSLEALDRAACEFGSSREELLLALFDDDLRDEFEEEHGEDPRSITSLGPALLGL
ncbi:MAG TPA: MFS transporter [Solirubrobacterales bacterium]|jgi:MFS family permease|nr:MFS transporter [Solirubrobacterales bacterium]